MNALKQIMALMATLAFSLIGVGAADLPFGEIAWQNHMATNGYLTVVGVYQYDAETGEGVEFWPGQEGTRFASYNEFISYIQRELTKAEEFITEELGFDPFQSLVVYIGTVVWPANTTPPHYGINDFIYVGNMIPDGNGRWEFPENFVGSIKFEYDKWQVLPLKKKVVSAKLSYTNRVTGRVDEQDTAKADGFPERLIKVNSKGSVSVREDFVWANPNYDMVLTVRYADGKTESWDENGKVVGEAPIPAKLMITLGSNGLNLSLTGTIGQRVTIQKLTEFKYWEDVRTVVFTNTTIQLPHDAGTNTVGIFRLTE